MVSPLFVNKKGGANLKNKRTGYTLMEIVLVIVLISILASGIAIGYTKFINKAKDAGVDNDLKTINVTIDYMKEKKGRLPNIKEVQEEMGEHGYKFKLTKAIISEIDSEIFITIRAESTQLSKYNIPYALNIVAEYNEEFGAKLDGESINVEYNKEALINFNPDSITMLILDNTRSGVPEIYWIN